MPVYPTADTLDIAEPFRLHAEALARWHAADKLAHAAENHGDDDSAMKARLARYDAAAEIAAVEHHLAQTWLAGLRYVAKYWPAHPVTALLELPGRVNDLEQVFVQEANYAETR